MSEEFSNVLKLSLEAALAPIMGRLEALEQRPNSGQMDRPSPALDGERDEANGQVVASGRSPSPAVYASASGRSPLPDVEHGQATASGRSPLPSCSVASEPNGHVTASGRSPLPSCSVASEPDGHATASGRSPLSASTVDPLTELVDETLASSRKRPVSSETSSFVERIFRRSLSQEQQAALRRAYPCPDVPACVPPSLDQSLGEVVDTSRHVDDQLYQIQTRLLRTAGPLVALQDGLEGEVTSEPDAVVSAADVLDAVKAALHFLGTTNNFMSVQRRSAHIQRIDPSLVSLAAEGFPDAGEELFGPQLIERLTKRADAQRTISSLLSRIRADRKRPHDASPDHRGAKRRSTRGFRVPPSFFRGAGPASYGGRSRGSTSRPYHSTRPSMRHAEMAKPAPMYTSVRPSRGRGDRR